MLGWHGYSLHGRERAPLWLHEWNGAIGALRPLPLTRKRSRRGGAGRIMDPDCPKRSATGVGCPALRSGHRLARMTQADHARTANYSYMDLRKEPMTSRQRLAVLLGPLVGTLLGCL